MPALFKHRHARQNARMRLEAEKAEVYAVIQEALEEAMSGTIVDLALGKTQSGDAQNGAVGTSADEAVVRAHWRGVQHVSTVSASVAWELKPFVTDKAIWNSEVVGALRHLVVFHNAL